MLLGPENRIHPHGERPPNPAKNFPENETNVRFRGLILGATQRALAEAPDPLLPRSTPNAMQDYAPCSEALGNFEIPARFWYSPGRTEKSHYLNGLCYQPTV
jgi:hypothetical protein